MEHAGEDLFNYAIDREDVEWLLANLSPAAEINRGKVEYELQILKIISVGWTISYHLEEGTDKTALLGAYWGNVHEFSRNLSTTTGVLYDRPVDYFQAIRDHLDLYVKAMAERPEAREPAAVIGPEFARICGNANDIETIACGTRMCVTVLARVKEYLDAVRQGRH
jgi:hypothetical protein